MTCWLIRNSCYLLYLAECRTMLKCSRKRFWRGKDNLDLSLCLCFDMPLTKWI